MHNDMYLNVQRIYDIKRNTNNSVTTLPKALSNIYGERRRNKNGTKYMKRLVDQPY